MSTNREIKFRAWDKTMKLMRYAVDVKNSVFGARACYAAENTGVIFYCENQDEEVLMQYTGLKDKNNIEIYEGDIIQATGIFKLSGSVPHNIGNMPKHIPHKVFFHEGAFKFKHNSRSINHSLTGLTIKYFGLEVIGNHYEHKHLLESEKTKI